MSFESLNRRTLVRGTAGAATVLATCGMGVPAQSTPAAQGTPAAQATPGTPMALAADAADVQQLRIAANGLSVRLDPHLSYGRGSIGPFTNLMWAGLTKVSADLETVPDITRDWEVSDNGLIYTFHLDPDRKFSDGSPITAEEIVQSWHRSLNPETESLVAGGYLRDVVGARDYWQGNTTELPTGYRAIDEFTFEVTLIEPRNFFPDVLVHPTTFVIKAADVAAGTPETPWYLTTKAFSGPFMVQSYEERQSLVLTRNEYHPSQPSLETISYRLVDDPQTQFLLYQNNEVDVTPLGIADADNVKNQDPTYRGELVEQPIWWLDNLYFRQGLAPFDDERVRRAFAMAVDTQSIIQVVERGLYQPMNGIYHPELDVYTENQPSLSFDPAAAQAELEQSSYGGAGGLPPVSFWITGEEPTGTESRRASALQEMWRQNLGVEVEIRVVPTYEEMLESDVQLVIGGEGMQYIDAANAVSYLRCDSSSNIAQFCNEAWEGMVEEAATTPDEARKLELYQEAERVVLEQSALLPLWRRVNYFLVKPYVRNFVTTAMFTFPTMADELYITES